MSMLTSPSGNKNAFRGINNAASKKGDVYQKANKMKSNAKEVREMESRCLS